MIFNIDKQLFKNTFMLYLLKIITIIFPLITFPYLTRILGTTIYGKLILATSIITYLKILVEFGFGLMGIKEASQYSKDKDYLSRLFTKITLARSFLLILGAVIVTFLLLFIESFRNNSLLIIVSFLQLIPLVFGADFIYYGQEKMSVITYRTLAGNLLYTLIILIFVKNSSHVYIVPIAAFINGLIVVLWSYIYMYKKFGVTLKKTYDINIFGIIKEAAPFFIASLSSIVFTTGNILVLGAFGHSEYEIGIFGVATNLMVFIRSFFSPISDSLFPYMVKKRDFRLIKLILSVLMPVILIGVMVLYYFSDFFITVFAGVEYIDASTIFIIYLPLILITLPLYLLGFPTLGALNKLNIVNKTVLYSAIFHVVSIVIMLVAGNLSIINLAILTVVSESIVLMQRVIAIIIIRKKIQYEI